MTFKRGYVEVRPMVEDKPDWVDFFISLESNAYHECWTKAEVIQHLINAGFEMYGDNLYLNGVHFGTVKEENI